MYDETKEQVRIALRITTDTFDSQLEALIAAGLEDLAVAGVNSDLLQTPEAFPLIQQAVITYCRLHFGEPSDPERLATSYGYQKTQLARAYGYQRGISDAGI